MKVHLPVHLVGAARTGRVARRALLWRRLHLLPVHVLLHGHRPWSSVSGRRRRIRLLVERGRHVHRGLVLLLVLLVNGRGCGGVVLGWIHGRRKLVVPLVAPLRLHRVGGHHHLL